MTPGGRSLVCVLVMSLELTGRTWTRSERTVDRIVRQVGSLEKTLDDIRDVVEGIQYQTNFLEREMAHMRQSYSFFARLNDNKEIRFELDEVKGGEKVKDVEGKDTDVETDEGTYGSPETKSDHINQSHVGIPILILDMLITNKGNAYNNTTGYFIAPVNGTYMFSVNIAPIGRDNRSFRLHLMLDDAVVLYAKKHDTEYHAVLRLQEGQKVWLEVPRITGLTKAFGRYGKYTSFSGMLLNVEPEEYSVTDE